MIYIQGHSSPGIYARAYLERRLSGEQLHGFRQEVERGLRIAGFLQKPYTLERLREALELAMRA